MGSVGATLQVIAGWWDVYSHLYCDGSHWKLPRGVDWKSALHWTFVACARQLGEAYGTHS